MKCLFRAAIQVGILAASVLSAAAGTNGFVIADFRGNPYSRYFGWEVFSSATSANSPDMPGSGAGGVLTQLDPGAIITGSGNIYNMGGLSRFEISYNGGLAGQNGAVDRVVLQIRTAGTELAYDSLKLVNANGTFTTPRVELDRVSFGAPGQPGSGVFVSSKWEWDLPDNDSTFNLSFSAAESSLSLDSITLDVKSVPEPGQWALFAVGLGGMVLAWKRR